MDFTHRIESFERETRTWERFAEEMPGRKEHHRGIAEAARELGALLSSLQGVDPTTQARKLYTYRNAGPRPRKPEESHIFYAAYLAKRSLYLPGFDMDCSELYSEVHSLRSLIDGPNVQAWLRGEDHARPDAP